MEPVGDPPGPHGVRTVDELVGRLRQLRTWAGVGYHELHRRIVRLRRPRGIPERLAYNTVYRCLQALDLFREIGDRVGEGGALTNLGIDYDRLGRHAQSIDCAERALVVFGEIGNRAGEGYVSASRTP